MHDRNYKDKSGAETVYLIYLFEKPLFSSFDRRRDFRNPADLRKSKNPSAYGMGILEYEGTTKRAT